ncbi:hypothetical protein RCCGEPOP_19433 [Rhizobium sp. Pop5]|nr:hypothetical protein RCCGEPOP_19433 [Rhizobium sp. Pop5]
MLLRLFWRFRLRWFFLGLGLRLLFLRRWNEFHLDALVFGGLRLDLRQSENEKSNDRNVRNNGRDDTPADFRPLLSRFVLRFRRFHVFFCHSSDVAFKTGSIKPQIEKTS